MIQGLAGTADSRVNEKIHTTRNTRTIINRSCVGDRFKLGARRA
jgi:hypothetical protein